MFEVISYSSHVKTQMADVLKRVGGNSIIQLSFTTHYYAPTPIGRKH